MEKGDVTRRHGGPKESAEACVLLPEGEFAVGVNKSLCLHQEKGARVRSLKGVIRCMTAAPGAKALAVGDSDGAVRFVDVAGFKETLALSTHKGPVLSLAYGGKGTRLVSGGEDRLIVVRELRTNATKVLKGHAGPVHAVAVSSDGKWVASAGKDGTVRLWHVGTGREEKRYTGHKGAVNGVAFDSKGKMLLSCGDAVREWVLPPEAVSKVP